MVMVEKLSHRPYLKPMVAVLALLLLLILSSSWHKGEDNINKSDIRNQQSTNPTSWDYDKLKFEGFTISELNGSNQLVKLTAKQLIHRKRKAKFFVYQNVKEIYLKDTQLDFSPLDVLERENRIIIPFNIIAECFEAIAPVLRPSDTLLTQDSDMDLDIVSRIIFDNLSIRITLPEKDHIAIHADSASIPTSFRFLILQGNVRVEPGIGPGVIAPQAVWVFKEGGIFFPDGNSQGNTAINEPTFYDVVRKGALKRREQVLAVDFNDPLDKHEAELEANIAKRIPLYARLLFGLTPQMK